MYSLKIQQIQTLQQFQQFEAGIRHLLFLHQDVLLDDFSSMDVECLVENTSTCIPWLWIVIDDVSRVFGLVSLTDIIPGRHAYLHGVSDPVIRRHAIIQEIAERAIHTAFQQLRVAKIKIEIESSNRAAKGFCLRMGFTREACFKRDNRLRGEWQDVLVYSLFQKCYSSCPADI